MSGHTPIDAERIGQIERLLREGAQSKEIVKRVHVSSGTISKIRTRLGLGRQKPGPLPVDQVMRDAMGALQRKLGQIDAEINTVRRRMIADQVTVDELEGQKPRIVEALAALEKLIYEKAEDRKRESGSQIVSNSIAAADSQGDAGTDAAQACKACAEAPAKEPEKAAAVADTRAGSDAAPRAEGDSSGMAGAEIIDPQKIRNAIVLVLSSAEGPRTVGQICRSVQQTCSLFVAPTVIETQLARLGEITGGRVEFVPPNRYRLVSMRSAKPAAKPAATPAKPAKPGEERALRGKPDGVRLQYHPERHLMLWMGADGTIWQPPKDERSDKWTPMTATTPTANGDASRAS